MRIGLIGVGRIGVFHARTLRGLLGVDSLIITDADLDRAWQVAGEFEARIATRAAITPLWPSSKVTSVAICASVAPLYIASTSGA